MIKPFFPLLLIIFSLVSSDECATGASPRVPLLVFPRRTEHLSVCDKFLYVRAVILTLEQPGR